jgi:hypothetical protein
MGMAAPDPPPAAGPFLNNSTINLPLCSPTKAINQLTNECLCGESGTTVLLLLVSSSAEAGIMAEIHKVSVEKTLNKIRGDDAKQSKEAAFNAKNDVLNEEIRRMRAQRQRLERHQGKHHQERNATPTPPQRHTFRKWVSRLFWFLRS